MSQCAHPHLKVYSNSQQHGSLKTQLHVTPKTKFDAHSGVLENTSATCHM